MGPSKELKLVWVWLHAGATPVFTDARPTDLADNPLAPTPPAGIRRQFLNADEALERLLASPWASGRPIDRRLARCRGAGRHYHLVGQTIYRHFRCSVLLKPKKQPKPKSGDPPAPDFGTFVSVWVHVMRAGSIRTTKKRPTDLWP